MECSECLQQLQEGKEVFWKNPELLPFAEAEPLLRFSKQDIREAEARLQRFAPLIMRLFPETKETGGLIESPLRKIPVLQQELGGGGRLFLKCDSHLAIAGSVKARGGIYEVLKHTEELAMEAGFLTAQSGPGDYEALADKRDFFAEYAVQVGSTGNLGMSIGIMSAALGYRAVVHMSADAKEWKKELLRKKGVIVKEYAEDYGKAVCEGRKLSMQDPKSYFVDDESSSALFLGYATAGRRLKKQLDDSGVIIDAEHPMAVYIPCGIGGAPGGITFGLKECFGDAVHCYFVEPVQAPCMLLGMATGKGNAVCVQDFGLTGKTEADGLAVSRPSGLVAGEMRHLVSGILTVQDEKLYSYMKRLQESEHIVIEPSSCAALEGFVRMAGVEEKEAAVHVAWATGGSLMPDEIVQEYMMHKA